VIVGYGTVALDTVETPLGRAEGSLGGSAIYFAAAASLHRPVGILGVVGTDYPWGDLDALVARGVELGGLETREGRTMAWQATYGAEGERATATRRGVSRDGPPRVPGWFRGAELLFLGSTDPAHQAAVLEGVAPKGPVVLDTMGHWIEDRRDEVLALVARCRVVLVTASEAAALAEVGAGDAPHALLDRGPDWVVVKHGARGATAHADDERIHVPAVPGVTPVDPSGAGDAFAGGLVARLGPAPWTRDRMADALAHGAASAALAVSDFGIGGLVAADEAELARLAERARVESDAALD
jgi:sugar/nucleoside kinase (ribokinase family)